MNFPASSSSGSGILSGSGRRGPGLLQLFCPPPYLRNAAKITNNNRVNDLKTKYLLLSEEGKQEIEVQG